MTPLALDTKATAAALSISSRKLWELTNSGGIPHVRVGQRILYPVDALRQWLNEQLPERFRVSLELFPLQECKETHQ